MYQIVQNLTVDGAGSESCGDGQIAGSRPSSGHSIRIEVLSLRVIPTLVSLLPRRPRVSLLFEEGAQFLYSDGLEVVGLARLLIFEGLYASSTGIRWTD